jgi:hypothetical protein
VLGKKSGTAAVPGPGILRIEPNGLAVICNRKVILQFCMIRQAAAFKGTAAFGVEVNRLGEIGDSAVVLTFGGERVTTTGKGCFERDKIRGAVRTDFILSAEIIVISLGTVAKEAFAVQVGVLIAIAVLMTVGVYGLVAGIVKLDDAGLFLSQHEGESGLMGAKRALGRGILQIAPWLMKFLSIAGTAAMFLVGGGILTHNVPPLDFSIEAFPQPSVLGTLFGMLADLVVGVIAGAVLLGVVKLIGKLRRRPPSNKPA